MEDILIFFRKFAASFKKLMYLVLEKEKRFEAFFKENYIPFYYFALQLTNDEETSKDIVNDSFEFAWTKIDTIDVANWKSYLLGYIRNKSVDYIRHQEVKKRYVEFYQKLMMENKMSHSSEYDERIYKVRKIMQDFSPQTRLIFQECYLREKKYKEVAGELGISESAVKKHIMKGLRILRESFVNKG